jgi:hypothetical protein
VRTALEMVSFSLEDDEEQERLRSPDPVVAELAHKAHTKMVASVQARLELNVEHLVALIRDGTTPSSGGMEGHDSDSQDVHYHMACWLGIEGILRERKTIYEYFNQTQHSEAETQEVAESGKRIISMTKGLTSGVIRVDGEAQQGSLRFVECAR